MREEEELVEERVRASASGGGTGVRVREEESTESVGTNNGILSCHTPGNKQGQVIDYTAEPLTVDTSEIRKPFYNGHRIVSQ